MTPSLSAPRNASFSRLPVIAFAILLAMLAGCSAKQANEHGQQALAERAVAHPARQLAYEHAIGIDTAPDKVATIYGAGLAACRDAAAACTLLASSIHSEPEAGASLTFRAGPAVIPTLVAAMSRGATLARQSTSAEDLSGPIADTARQLAMLEDYRTRLEGLRSRAGNDIEALIKINHELAEVQSNYEAAAGKRAAFAQRVDTEILKVSISADRQRPFWGPIGRALAGFGSDLAQGIAFAISGLAYLVPSLLMIAMLAWAVRKLWRRRRGGK